MKLIWEIGDNKYPQDLDMKQFLHIEEIPIDSNPWLGMNLLDVEAFRQYKKSISTQDNKGREYYSQIIKQYNIIDSIITEALVDATLIHEMHNEASSFFEQSFADLINQLTPYLHSHKSLPMESIVVPTSEREDINQLLNRIRSVISDNAMHEHSKENSNQNDERSLLTLQKNIIRKLIVQIALKYSDESKKRYNAFYTICKKNDIRGVYTYDFAKVAVCANTTQDYIKNIEDVISTRVHIAFENRLNLEDFQTGLSTEKIDEINKYFSERDYIEKGKPHYDEMSGKYRKYFIGRKRCVAIMEFPDNESHNMFALSGTELCADKTYLSTFEMLVANKIARELNLTEKYIFCKQNVLVRRYAHKKSENTYIKLPHWNYLDDDIDWKSRQNDYSCCERKFIAKLEMDNQSGIPFPRNIILWTRLNICDNCDYALIDYEKSYGAVILRV